MACYDRKMTTPLLLIILDGWGYRLETASNAIAAARTPHWDALWARYPHTLLSACGTDVGLPAGQMGNSEVGHLNIGAGRIIYQDSQRITEAIRSGDFFHNPALLAALAQAKKPGSRLHLLGLCSDGGVHSLQTHALALLDLCAQHKIRPVLHAFLDGRDTPPKSAGPFLTELQEKTLQTNAQWGSVMGRYYAMDRDQRWERTQSALACLTHNSPTPLVAQTALQALELAYARGESDEFVQPTRIEGAPPIRAEDAVIFFNFRADRARQLSLALVQALPTLGSLVTLTDYSPQLRAKVAFSPLTHRQVLGEVLSNNHLKQLRLAETEKYAHVTFFFNGGIETPFPGEKRDLIPSPKVATYDLQPEMSAPLLSERLIRALEHQEADVIIVNFANADMVGHTGNFPATVQAIESLDACLGRLIPALLAAGGEALITADHGNADQMFDALTQQAHTAHTLSPVPLLYIGRPAHLKESGRLCDVAPTVLQLLAISQPPDMTGEPLITW